jgi:hypothetical protein
MKALLIGWLVLVPASVWVAYLSPPSFQQRWSPAMQHPVHAVSGARTGFCYPIQCLIR